ncbi:MAG: carboxypeptidase regulatory-like domain-containing protein [Saprospiraceae bacterium]|nr:carboxypeptidase regulatory-like domain-containing protein [Saprospiraceae bacterium]
MNKLQHFCGVRSYLHITKGYFNRLSSIGFKLPMSAKLPSFLKRVSLFVSTLLLMMPFWLSAQCTILTHSSCACAPFQSSKPAGVATSLWVNIHTKLGNTCLPNNGDFILYRSGSIELKGINASWTTATIPDGKIIADNTVSAPITSFDISTNTWITKVPPGYATSVIFISGGLISSSSGYAITTNPQTIIKGQMYSNRAGYSSTWFYGIAAYQPTFTYNDIAASGNIVSVGSSTNRPGTINNMKNRIVPGGTCDGSTYTGLYGSIDNFTACQVGSIGDFAYCDNNANAIYDTGDTPQSGVQVTLCNTSNVVIATATTNTLGKYSFPNLTAGTYIVKFPTTITGGKTLTTSSPITVALTAGQNFLNADGGYKPPVGSIGDLAYCDNNGNAIYDAGDTPQSGVQVTLCNASNVVITTTTTDAQGKYSFPNLAAGTYIVKFPATLGGGKNITTPNPMTVNLAAGQNFVNTDAGYYKAPVLLGTIGDLIFCDNNNNGVYDNGDTPISGVTVTLCNSNGQAISTTVSSTNGLYLFSALAAGTYIVKFTPTLSDGKNLTTAPQITVNLVAGQNFLNADAGYYKPTPQYGSIGDFVFCDNNNNAVFDNGDIPISGVTVTLCDASGQVITTTTSNLSGNYTFSFLTTGTYIVKFPATLADGKNITTQSSITVNLTAGQNVTTVDGGYFKPTNNDFCTNPTANVTTGAGAITISGITTSAAMIQVFNSSWVSVYNQQISTSNVTIPNLPSGTYYVKVTVLSAGGTWPLICEKLVTITVSGGPTCPDGTPKKTPGTACNDNNPNTINDVIQADGCGCAGTPVVPNCNENRNNTITKFCVGGKPVLTGTALAGYEYMWISSTTTCAVSGGQPIPGATSQNYYLPTNVTQTTYFSRCARPIGCTEWGAIAESNCLTVTPADCGTPTGGCDAISVIGNSNGTISVTGLGSYTSQIQIFNSQWQPVFNQQYNSSTVIIPIKNGGYIVKVQLYNTNGTWQFVCEKIFNDINVIGSLASLLSGRLVLDLTAASELHRVKLAWSNNTGYKNDYFELEKLNETSGQFEKIALINSMNGDKLEYYTAFDEQPTEGDNIYRINLIGTDGTAKVSNQSVVKFNKAYDFRIFPNPVSDYIDVDLKQYEGKAVTLQIYNSFGKIIATQQVERASSLPVHLDLSQATAGQYLIRITSQGRKAAIKKFSIQN